MNINPIQSFNYSPAAMRNNQLQKVNSKPNFKGHINTSIEHYEALGEKARNINFDSIEKKLKDLRFKLEMTGDEKVRVTLKKQIENLEYERQEKLDKIKSIFKEMDEIFYLNGWGSE